jgi:hypothetical protein
MEMSVYRDGKTLSRTYRRSSAAQKDFENAATELDTQ